MFNMSKSLWKSLRALQQPQCSARHSAGRHHHAHLSPGSASLRGLTIQCLASEATNAAGSAATTGVSSSLALRIAAGALVVGGASVLALTNTGKASAAASSSEAAGVASASEETKAVVKKLASDVDWVATIAEGEGVTETQTAGMMLRDHPVGRHFVDRDHLFQNMVEAQAIHELRCFYDKNKKQFYSVVHLGKDICGFPQTVHGGLTAAIMDETFGGLAISQWRGGALGLNGPPYTARLEVDYKARVPAGALILCVTEVESIQDRKLWMRAKVTDGGDTVYAQGRALFVAQRVLPNLFGSKQTVKAAQ